MYLDSSNGGLAKRLSTQLHHQPLLNCCGEYYINSNTNLHSSNLQSSLVCKTTMGNSTTIPSYEESTSHHYDHSQYTPPSSSANVSGFYSSSSLFMWIVNLQWTRLMVHRILHFLPVTTPYQHPNLMWTASLLHLFGPLCCRGTTIRIVKNAKNCGKIGGKD